MKVEIKRYIDTGLKYIGVFTVLSMLFIFICDEINYHDLLSVSKIEISPGVEYQIKGPSALKQVMVDYADYRRKDAGKEKSY